MEYLTLNNDVKMPLVGLGTWDLRGETCTSLVSEAIQLGYRLIDTAQMYDNEKEVGQGIARTSVNRDDLFITTKLDGRCNGYKQARDGIIHSLDNLSLDYVNLLLVHEPYSNDIAMYEALSEAYHDGKVKAIGISNYDQKRFEQFLKKVDIIPAVNQVECHIQFQKWALQQKLGAHGTVMQAWSPLGQGKLGIDEQPELIQLAEKYKKSPSQIVLRFLTQRGVSVIPKTKRIERLEENMSIFDFQLLPEEMNRIKLLDRDETLFSWTEY
ncbi:MULTISPECIES: aldo/keto reductase [unclassified Staphylococcus]|uniref:aldo/keto reductase n=1 Tax=unclassified Staphylococcus TaxID=91994 RepID=UPI0021D1EF15|nr:MULTISPECIES: aldo/keto reductase [unclassified Staphylococcus]UXR71058.1 aldo/keto reductase [Staphylococcus sp. IVB6240]UXR73283.1 aldo/keto reductase [Staphylococcus sp. IVB6238]UXR75583.1 aldo/keto reductase [Staphylococcus sp. IVB6233]UXR79784.1 aldo/keto reductase [Staphylococcus sp. IVB6218]